MKNVICTSFSTSGSGQGGEPMESVALNFSQVNFDQYLRDDANQTRPVRGGYDFTTAKKI